MKKLKVFIFFTALFTSIYSFGDPRIDYDWRACAEQGDISELKHSNVPFKGSGLDLTRYKFIKDCVPDTLFSWQGGGSLLKILDLAKKDGLKSTFPFHQDSILGPRGLYFWRSPAGTFGYNDILLRVKLKKDTQFIYIDELKDHACTWVKDKYKKFPPKTVFVRYKSGLEIVDFIMCDDTSIHSWSVWTPENLKEIKLEKDHIQKSHCSKMVNLFSPVDKLEKDLKSLIEERKEFDRKIKRYQRKIEKYERKKKKPAKKSRKKLKRAQRGKDQTEVQIVKIEKKLHGVVEKALGYEKNCLSWEAYSNASKFDSRLFKIVNLFQRISSETNNEVKLKLKEGLKKIGNRLYPKFFKEKEEWIVIQQFFGDRNRTKEIRSSCGHLILGHCMDRSKENWSAIQLERKMQLFGETYTKLTGKKIRKLKKSKSDLKWWNKKKPDEKARIEALKGKEILMFAPDAKGKSREDHFSSRFKTIYNP